MGRGYSTILGVDYDETFSPVAKMVTFRIFLTIVAVYSLHTCALDVKTAFWNAKMEREVCMTPPPNLKTLLRELLKHPDLTEAQTKEIRRQIVLLGGGILLYVDNIIITATSKYLANKCMTILSSFFLEPSSSAMSPKM